MQRKSRPTGRRSPREKPFHNFSRRLTRQIQGTVDGEGACRGDTVHHVHSKHHIHGDVNLKNVVRYDNRLCLIDLDVAVTINSDSCFKEIKQENDDVWAKVNPKDFGYGSKVFAVKTFLTEVEATAAIDIWSFGAVLYTLHTGSSLFAICGPPPTNLPISSLATTRQNHQIRF
jgi:serine/threonine protein kinase